MMLGVIIAILSEASSGFVALVVLRRCDVNAGAF